MEFQEFKQYIIQVQNNPKFKKLDKFLHMSTFHNGDDRFENMQNYLKHNCSKKYDITAQYDFSKVFQPDYEYCVRFLEHFLKDNPMSIEKTHDGYIDLDKTLYMKQPIRYSAGEGTFCDGWIILTDGTKYLTKKPVYETNTILRMENKYSVFSPVIASYIAKTLGVPAAEILLGRIDSEKIRIISKNFRNENEDVLVFCWKERNETISEYLKEIDYAFSLRKYLQNEIEQAKFEALKKEFVAKLCGIKDQSNRNDPMIIEFEENGNRHVRIAPMFDLDYSFHIAEQEQPDMLTRKCDNGKDDIGSLIIQYKDYPGFKEFARKAIRTLEMRKIFNQIYSDTGIEKFKEGNDSEMNKFIEFVEANIELAKKTLDEIDKPERGVR